MMASLLSKATLTVTIEQDMIRVHPSADPSLPSEDPTLRGTVLLSLPSRRSVKRINVLLEGLCDVSGGPTYKYESTVSLHKEINLDLGGQVLEEGCHAFNFEFIIPSSTACYQRCQYGRIRHYVKGKAEFAGNFTTTISSSSVAVFISASDSAFHEIPEPLEINIEHFSKDLGPIAIGISSPHLTVASLVYIRLGFVHPSRSATIASIKTFITQSFEVSYNDPSVVATPPPSKYLLAVVDETSSPEILGLPAGKDTARALDPEPLVELEEGREWRFGRLTRVPDDDHVRPSTLPGSETRINVSHKLSVEVRYKVNGESKLITITKPVTIASCCSLIDSVFLPAYVKAAPKTIVRPVNARCLCNLSLKEMVDRDGYSLERAGTIDLPSDSRILGVGRSDKSPGYSSRAREGFDF